MTTSVIHSDVIGSSYTNTQGLINKLRAVRKFIVKSDVDMSAAAGHETIVNELKGETTANGVISTALGPLYNNPGSDGTDGDGTIGQVSGAPIVHPSNNNCFLQTVELATLGDQRYLVTAVYGIVPGQAGGGSSPNAAAQFRVITKSVRRYKKTNDNGELVTLIDTDGLSIDQNPVQFSVLETVPVMKIQVPFFTMTSPVTSSTNAAVGGLNDTEVVFNGQTFPPYSCRFDGVQMDEYSGARVSGSGVPYLFRGFYEFTVDPTYHREEIPVPKVVEGEKRWVFEIVYSGVRYDSFWSTLSGLGLP